MSKVRIELNKEGVRELLKSQEMMEVCKEAANLIIDNYGEGAELTEYVGKTRVNVSIVAPRDDALNDNKLLKAMQKDD